MSMIDLPDWPAPVSARARLQDFGGFLTPGLGGPVQRINRAGSRFALSVTLPPLDSEMNGRIWVSRLIRGKSEGVRMRYPLLGFNPGSPGSPLVDGADQAGRMLAVKSATRGYIFREGQPFSLEEDGQHFMHFMDEEVIADGAGAADIVFSTMLRVPPSDGAALHFGKPMIEGYIAGDELAWEMAVDHNLSLSFEILERR